MINDLHIYNFTNFVQHTKVITQTQYLGIKLDDDDDEVALNPKRSKQTGVSRKDFSGVAQQRGVNVRGRVNPMHQGGLYYWQIEKSFLDDICTFKKDVIKLL